MRETFSREREMIIKLNIDAEICTRDLCSMKHCSSDLNSRESVLLFE